MYTKTNHGWLVDTRLGLRIFLFYKTTRKPRQWINISAKSSPNLGPMAKFLKKQLQSLSELQSYKEKSRVLTRQLELAVAGSSFGPPMRMVCLCNPTRGMRDLTWRRQLERGSSSSCRAFSNKASYFLSCCKSPGFLCRCHK